MAQIELHGAGVIALSGCLASRLCARIADGRVGDGREHIDQLFGALGAENVYFEVQKERAGATGPLQTWKSCGWRASWAAHSSARVTSTICAARNYNHHTALLCVQNEEHSRRAEMTFETNGSIQGLG